MKLKILFISLITFCLIFTIPTPVQSVAHYYTGDHWDIAPNTNPRGIATDETNFWIVEWQSGAIHVDKYDMSGNYVSTFNEAITNAYSEGICTDDTNIWVVGNNGTTDSVFKFSMAGTLVDEWSVDAQSEDPKGITTDGTNIWVVDYSDKEVYKYDMDGNYVNSWGLLVANSAARGITTNGSNIWVVDANSNVYKHDMDGTWISIAWSLNTTNGDPHGITMNGTYFWVVDNADDEVYLYSRDRVAPTPNPSTWSSEPEEMGATDIFMYVTEAYDSSGVVEYYFNETTGHAGGTSSGWQASRYYRDWYLTANTQYSYEVKSRDKYGNEGTYSTLKSATTKNYIYTLDVTYPQYSFATLRTQVYDVTGDVGFYVSNNTVSSTSFEQNISVDTYNDYTGIITHNVDLNQSTYYHVMAWYIASNGTFYTGDESFFITPPQYTTSSLTVNEAGYTWLNLTWTNNFFEHTSANQTTVIKFQTQTYPTWENGYDFYNGTGTYCNSTGIVALGFETTLYFTSWTYVNDTGSPHLWAPSAAHQYASGTTLSGLYNISVRWENSTYNKIPLNLETRDKHKHIFYVLYSNRYEENYYEEGEGWYSTDTNDFEDSSIADGNWTIQITSTPREMKFVWEGYDSSWFFWDSGDHCSRTVVLDQFTDNNIEIYLRTDLHYVPLMLGGIVDWMNQSFLGQYVYEFVDNHGDFSLNEHPYAYIYTYDSGGNKRIIHSEYLDQSMQISPSLVFGKTYYIGIKSDSAEITYLGKASTGTDGHVVVVIPRSVSYDYSIFDYIDVSVGTTDNLLYVDFLDTTYTTVNASIDIVYYLNGTEVYDSSTTLDTYNFTFTSLDGFDNETNYAWRLNITFQTLGTFTTGFIPVYAEFDYTITDITSLDLIFELIFGPTPVVLSTGVGVSYAYLCVLVFGILGLLTFKPEQAHVGLIVEGLIFMLAAGAITGMQTLFSDYSWQQGIALGAVGFFLLILGIWASLSGKRKDREAKE